MTFRNQVIVAAALATAGGAICAQEVIIKIGSVAPTSGGAAVVGKDNENGVRLAVDELNRKGISVGGKKAKLELIAEDDAADPKQATAAAQMLADMKVNGVIGHQTSGTSIPASKVYSDAGIPQVSPMATNPKYTRQGFKTTFRVVADDVQLGATLGNYAVKELKGKSFAIIDDRTAYGQGLAEEFAKAVKAAGGSIVDQQYTTDKATDFSAILTAIRAKKPDAVFIGGMYVIAGPMIRQMKQLGLKAKVIGGDGICTDELVPLTGGAIANDQVICAEPGGVSESQKAGLAKFKELYKKQFGSEAGLVSAYSYDAVNVMVDAMVKAGSADPKAYLPVLAKTQGHKGVTGDISFDDRGDLKNGALTLYTFRNAKREQLAVVRVH